MANYETVDQMVKRMMQRSCHECGRSYHENPQEDVLMPHREALANGLVVPKSYVDDLPFLGRFTTESSNRWKEQYEAWPHADDEHLRVRSTRKSRKSRWIG